MRIALALLAMLVLMPMFAGVTFADSQKSCQFARDCDYDPATSRCEPGLENAESTKNFSGKICSCDQKVQKCRLEYFEPVQCKSDADCWVSEKPFTHAIKRPAKLRGHKFRGCKDGEHEPKCIENRCDLRGLKC